MTTPTTQPTRTVWDDLVGQRPTIEVLQQAAAGQGMTHAWLFTGPPGSGRSNVARAFAAALQCEQRTGCGACEACRLGISGSHPDITWVKSETSVLYVDDMRDLVQSAAKFPSIGRWQIVVIEDADRLGTPENPRTGNALLKAIEEPTPKTLWLLCAPTVQDVLPTIRSRCRTLTLSTPGTDDVAAFLHRSDGISETMAGFAARASQGHIGRARALALEPSVLLLDEPSAGLTRDERDDLARFVLRIKHELKLAMVWIEHDMQVVADLADRVHVLNHGRTLASGPPDSVLSDPQVIDAYLGRVQRRPGASG